jgi:hypothetical protein
MAGQFCAIRGMTVRAFSTTPWTATNNNNILRPEAAMVKVRNGEGYGQARDRNAWMGCIDR